MINRVKNRILFLSPSVREGLEKECSKEDFLSDGDRAIGKGGFGQVWKVHHKSTGKIYVIKVMNKQNIIDQKMTDQINREIEIMYKLNHPHIIKLFNHFEDDDNLYLIMHYASKGQLYSLLKKQGRIDQRTTAQYMREILSAVKYLHSFDPPIIHRDIKPENILLDENGRVKLADFGWSNYVSSNNELRKTYCGTPEYLAPEMVKKEGHDTSVDIWDLGVLMFELLAGKPPFRGMNQGELFSNIKKHKINWVDDFPPLAKNLISKILKQNPKERLTIDQILNHNWFDVNPPLRPVLIEQKITERQWLESHMINARTENTNKEINNIIKSKRKSILEMIKKLDIPTTNSNMGNNININNNNNINIVNINDSSLISENSNINEDIKNTLMKEINSANEKIEKLKKENSELKQKNDKYELEIRTLKNDLTKANDPMIKAKDEIKIIQLQEELEKCQILNENRLGLINEVEIKTNKIVELNLELQKKKDEIENLQRDNYDLNKKLNNINSENEKLKEDLESLKTKYINKIKERDDTILQLQKPVQNFPPEKNVSLFKTQNLYESIKESINECKDLFKKKTDNLTTILDELKEDSYKTEQKFSEILQEIHSDVIETIKKFNESIEEVYRSVKLLIIQDNPVKDENIIEWVKKRVGELFPFKIKCENLEVTCAKMENTIKNYEQNLSVQKNELEILKKIKEENIKINKINENKIENLEAKLADIKDFIFRNFPEKLDEFKKWFHFKPSPFL